MKLRVLGCSGGIGGRHLRTTSLLVDNDILIAYKQNGQDLLPERGYPFQLVAVDKWGYKWIKWITKIELTDSNSPGYWESRGYSNDGSLNQSFIGG